MKKIFSTVLLLLVGWTAARAQVVVEVTLEQEQFLPGETLPVAVRISNRSGRTLHLGESPDWLTFSVQARDSTHVTQNGDVPVLGAFTLDSSKVATKRVELGPYFPLPRAGRYNVTATVRIKDWDGVAASPQKVFDIIPGTKVWSQEFGVPPGSATNQPPELRNFALLQANYLRSELRLYFRLTDATDTRVMKLFPLGQIVSFARPEAEVDSQSRLHVLHQNGAHTSLYTVLTSNGDTAVRRIYDYGKVRPRLQVDREGKISVAGGVHRPTNADIPAPEKNEDEPKPAKP